MPKSPPQQGSIYARTKDPGCDKRYRGCLRTQESRVLQLLFLKIVLLTIVLLGGSLENAAGVIIYRIGTPFSSTEKDSLSNLGIDFTEISWSMSQLEDALELDSLAIESVQPNYFSPDEDIAATLLSRNGKACVINTSYSHACHNIDAELLIDQNTRTAHIYPTIAADSFNRDIRERVTFDVGGNFLIREIRMRTLADKPEHFLERFTIGIAEGFSSRRIPIFPNIVAEVKENTESEISVFLDPPITTRAIQLLIFRQTPKEIGIADFELYGGGYVTKASYESDVIEMNDLASWGELRWSGRQDLQARVDIRTRTGSDRQPEIFWKTRPEQQDSIRFLGGGGYLTFTEYKKKYERVSDVFKPNDPADYVSVDTDNWSFWSSPYTFTDPGTVIVSPSPTKFIQFRMDFLSTVNDGGKIDYLEFKTSVPPAVRKLTGEIYPINTHIGEPTTFTYYIRPTIRAGDNGFDGIEISTPSGVKEVDSLRIAGMEHPDFLWTVHEDERGFDVILPRKLEPVDSGTLVEVVFKASVLREVGTLFNARVFDSSKPQEVRQRVNPGNASDEIDSDQLSVTTALRRSIVFAPKVEPRVFTPNNDGINDLTTISYTLLRLTSSTPITIEIFDLSGHVVKRLYKGNNSLGNYSHLWNGENEYNNRVPPGLYLYRMTISLQSGPEVHSAPIVVAY